MSNTGSPCISVVWLNASPATHIAIEIDKYLLKNGFVCNIFNCCIFKCGVVRFQFSWMYHKYSLRFLNIFPAVLFTIRKHIAVSQHYRHHDLAFLLYHFWNYWIHICLYWYWKIEWDQDITFTWIWITYGPGIDFCCLQNDDWPPGVCRKSIHIQ